MQARKDHRGNANRTKGDTLPKPQRGGTNLLIWGFSKVSPQLLAHRIGGIRQWARRIAGDRHLRDMVVLVIVERRGRRAGLAALKHIGDGRLLRAVGPHECIGKLCALSP